LEAAARAQGARILRFGFAEGADVRLDSVRLAQDTTIVQGHLDGGPLLYKIASPGRHFAMNAAGVSAVAQALGADPVVAACDLGLWRPPAGRGMRETVVMDVVFDDMRFDLIDDAYNANPASLGAALEVLAAAKVRDG